MVFTIKNAVKIYQLFVLAFVFITLLFVVPNKIYAAKQTLRVSPVIMNVPLSPGKTITQDVTIENLTNTPLPLRASLTDFVTGGEEGGYVFENTRTNPLLSWIKLSDDTFILNAKEKKHVTMTIKMPSSIPVGGYYGLLFFEPVLQNATTQGAQVSTKIGVLLLGNLGVADDHKQKADILTFTPNLLSQDGTVPFILRVQNIALNFFTAKPIITLTPMLPITKQPDPVYLEEKLIFPDKVRRWTQEQSIQNLQPNIYRVHLAVSTGNGQQVTTERYIIVFPVLKVLLGLAVLFVIIFLTTKRGRLRHAAHALFRS